MCCDSWGCIPVQHGCSLYTRSLPKLRSIELVMPSNHLILCNPLLLLPSIFPSKRLVWAAKQALGNAALGALFA